jgi:hypothetical protein
MFPLLRGFFEPHIETQLKEYMKNPYASSTRSLEIRKIVDPNNKMLEDIAVGITFKLSDGREFVKLRKRRVKWECLSKEGKMYIIPGSISVFF